MRHTILLGSSIDLHLRLANRRIGAGVVPDTPHIFVLLLVEMSANAKVLMHLMQCVVCMPFSESQLIGTELWSLEGCLIFCRRKGGTAVSPEV